MITLPIDSFLPQITRRLADSRSLVLVAQPGAGKTTRVPPAILRSGLLGHEHPNLVMLQPRRVAARAAAARIGQENNWEIGNEVGYQIRFEKRVGLATRLRVLTEGILTRQLLDDPTLAGVGCVILDEFHERSIHSDMALAMLREVRQTVRPDLLIVVMSATLEASAASRFLEDCPILDIPGRLFDVKIEYQPHAHLPLVPRVAQAIERQLEHDPASGDILVFLPGADEIRKVHRRLEELPQAASLAILPLHGRLTAAEQTRALEPSKLRKIILATNIAETSLTIDGVTRVVDAGLARVPRYDPRRGLDRLELTRISNASATQRAGRAGRTAPGQCIRLWSAKEQAALKDFEDPEIARVDLCAAVLDLHAWGKPDPRQFGWFQAPPESSIASAQRLLEMLGAMRGGQLSDLGRRLMKLPVHPRVGRLLLAAATAGCPDEGAALAALLSERDILRDQQTPQAREAGDSDLLLRLPLLDESRTLTSADPAALRNAQNAREQLQRIARRLSNHPRKPPTRQTLLKLPLLAYPDRVCRRRPADPAAAVMADGSGIRLSAQSVVRQAEFFVALDARHDPRSPSREATVAIASAIDPAWLRECFPQSIVNERLAVFDLSSRRVVGVRRVRYLELTLSEDRDSSVDPKLAGQTLAQALRPRAAEIFAADPAAAGWLARVDLLRRFMPEHPWPTFEPADLSDLLAERCQGKKSEQEVLASGLAAAPETRLAYPLDRILRNEAPEFLAVPSGSRIRLTYSPGNAPILAVRLQEIFGWTDGPRVAGGRVAVLLHLLGPNYRVVQITDDLRSFWTNAYFQVRKDLRVRYPRHSWPDDPAIAAPQAKGGRKKA